MLKQGGIAGATARGWDRPSAICGSRSRRLEAAELRAASCSASVHKEARCHLDAKAGAGMFNPESQDLGQDF